MNPLNEKEYQDRPEDYKANDPKMLNKLNDPETGLKAVQAAQNDAIATRMAKDTASSFGKSPPKPIPYMPPYKRINQQSISGPVTKANEENTMSLIHDKKTLSVADAVSKIMDEELKGNQHKIDANKNGKVDAHDFKLLRGKKTMKEEEQIDEAFPKKKTQSPDEQHKVVAGVRDAMRKGYDNVQKGRDERAAARFVAKLKYGINNSEKIDEAFPTVADGEKSLRAKEGKTSMGTVSKTKTGLVHTRDYEDDSDETPAKKGRPTGGGAGKSTKKKKLSEMIAAYKEKGIDSLYEEPDNETFTKELKDQKAKFDGKKKGGDVAKPSVQAVKMEEADYEEDDGPLSEEQLDELSKGTLGRYIKKAHFAGGMADFRHGMKHDKRGDSKDKMALAKTSHKREKGINKAVDRLAKEDVQLDERTLTADETKEKEKNVKGMKKSLSGFKDRYGDRAKEVMYATATKMAKKD